MKALEFEGRGGEYFRIWIGNISLVMVTLTLYSPWAKVRTRRYFHGHTTLEGRHFEYHATGRQLFVGYLVALALFVCYIVIGNLFPEAAQVLPVIIGFATPWLIWRSLKFNMRMTSFSTVRFGFGGTVGGAVSIFVFWPMLFGVSVGAALLASGVVARNELPTGTLGAVLLAILMLANFVLALVFHAFLRMRKSRYLVNGYRYGQGVFHTSVKTWGFAKILLNATLLILLAVALPLAALAVNAFAASVMDDRQALEAFFSDNVVFTV